MLVQHYLLLLRAYSLTYGVDFATHYQYLLWLYGNEPVKLGEVIVDENVAPELKYTIYENKENILEEGMDTFIRIGDVAISKEEL